MVTGTLEQLFKLALNSPEQNKQQVFNAIISQHRGLAKSFAAKCRVKAWEDMLSIMFIALPTAVAEWDPNIGAASTCWRNVSFRVADQERQDTLYIDCVRVTDWTHRKKKATKLLHNDAIERILTQWGHYDKEAKNKGKA